MAVTDPTDNFGFNLPTDGGDDGAWGVILRELWGGDNVSVVPNGNLDELLQAVREASTIDTTGDSWNVVDNSATRAAKVSGDVFTGEIDIWSARYETVNLGATLTGAVTLDLANGNFFYGTVTGDITIGFSNVPSADFVAIVVELTDSGGNNVGWDPAVTWPSGSTPPATSGGTDVYVLYTRDGGTTWRAARSMTDLS